MGARNLDEAVVDRLALALSVARDERRPIAPLTDEFPGLTIDDAYAIAARSVDLRVSAGACIVGHKIGLTAKAVQQQIGVDQPDFGALLDVMQIPDGGTIDVARLISPRVELEIAFLLGERLVGPGVTVAAVRSATEYVRPAIELVDSRIADWRIRLADTVADNASSAGFVLGEASRSLDELDVLSIEVALWRGDEIIEQGTSSAVLGDPCVAVAWLANALAVFGVGLEPGQVVLSGACTRMVAAKAGDAFRGVFAGLGEVCMNVAESSA